MKLEAIKHQGERSDLTSRQVGEKSQTSIPVSYTHLHMRVKMIVAYDGTNYCGWQIQPNGITIEQVLNEHLSRLLKEDRCV